MERGKKLVVIAHCIINQNSVVIPYAKNMKIFSSFIKNCMDKNIGILQLPCPESKIYGLKRWGHVKDQLEHTGFKNPAKIMLEDFVDTISDYIQAGYEILGVYGIKGSPSCGITLTCRGDWCGEASNYKNIEDISSKVKMVEEMGIFMELFKEILENKKISIPFVDIDDEGGNPLDQN